MAEAQTLARTNVAHAHPTASTHEHGRPIGRDKRVPLGPTAAKVPPPCPPRPVARDRSKEAAPKAHTRHATAPRKPTMDGWVGVYSCTPFP